MSVPVNDEFDQQQRDLELRRSFMPRFRVDDALNLTSRVGSYLALVELGREDMRRPEDGRVVSGLMGVAIFGRSVGWAVETFKRFDRPGYAATMEPALRAFEADEIVKYIYELRHAFIHRPGYPIAQLMSYAGPEHLRPARIRVEGIAMPSVYGGAAVRDLEHACDIFLERLRELVDEFFAYGWPVIDKLMKERERLWAGAVARANAAFERAKATGTLPTT